MQELFFSPAVQLGYILTAVIYFSLPAAAFFILHKYGAAKISPVLAGALVYFLSTRMCDLTVWLGFSSLPMAAKKVAAAELTAFFEETGRWLAMKYPVFNIRTSRGAVCYGIGHAGLECFVRGSSTFSIIGEMQHFSERGLSYYTDGRTEEQAAQITERISSYADRTLIISIMDIITIFIDFGVHIALTVLIFKKIKEQKSIRWLGLAILLHYSLNAASYIGTLAGSSLIGEFTVIFAGCGIIMLVWKLCNGNEVADEVIYGNDE